MNRSTTLLCTLALMLTTDCALAQIHTSTAPVPITSIRPYWYPPTYAPSSGTITSAPPVSAQLPARIPVGTPSGGGAGGSGSGGPSGGPRPAEIGAAAVLVCVGVNNPSIGCLSDDYEGLTLRLAKSILLGQALKLLLPEPGHTSTFAADLRKLEEKTVKIVEDRLRLDIARIQPFPHETRAEWEQKQVIIHNESRRLGEWANHARQVANAGTNWENGPSTPTTSSSTYKMSPKLKAELECVGAGNKAGCSWDGARGTNLYGR